MTKARQSVAPFGDAAQHLLGLYDAFVVANGRVPNRLELAQAAGRPHRSVTAAINHFKAAGRWPERAELAKMPTGVLGGVPIQRGTPAAYWPVEIPDGCDHERFVGKAGEFLVCFDLTLQGFDASLASRNHAYDIIADKGDRPFRVQVRTCSSVRDFDHQPNIYRFSTRTGNAKNSRRANPRAFDLYAFVALDIRRIAYMKPSDVLTQDGEVKQTVDFRSRIWPMPERRYSSGVIKVDWARFIEDFSRADVDAVTRGGGPSVTVERVAPLPDPQQVTIFDVLPAN